MAEKICKVTGNDDPLTALRALHVEVRKLECSHCHLPYHSRISCSNRSQKTNSRKDLPQEVVDVLDGFKDETAIAMGELRKAKKAASKVAKRAEWETRKNNLTGVCEASKFLGQSGEYKAVGDLMSRFVDDPLKGVHAVEFQAQQQRIADLEELAQGHAQGDPAQMAAVVNENDQLKAKIALLEHAQAHYGASMGTGAQEENKQGEGQMNQGYPSGAPNMFQGASTAPAGVGSGSKHNWNIITGRLDKVGFDPISPVKNFDQGVENRFLNRHNVDDVDDMDDN